MRPLATFLILSSVVAVGAAQTRVQGPVRDTRTVQMQQNANNKGVIAGVVVAADTGRPVRRATVSISGGTPRVARSVESDNDGAFRFADLPPGDYTLRTYKGGFIESVYGQKQPGSGRAGTPIRLALAQQLNRLALPLARGGVITGMVLDEVGDPAFGINIRAYRWTMESGERRLEPAGNGTTDDRGIYRIPGLVPGEYVVSAKPDSEQGMYFKGFSVHIDDKMMAMDNVKFVRAEVSANGWITSDHEFEYDGNATVPKTGFASIFYPGTMNASTAMSVPVGVGEERVGIDFQLQVVPFGRVSGAVTAPDGTPVRTEVMLIDRNQPPGFGTRSTRADVNGKFSFTGIQPGQYLLFTRGAPKGAKQLEASGGEAASFLASIADEKKAAEVRQAIAASTQLWGMVDVSTDGRDVSDIPLVLRAGSSVSGMVQFEAGPGAPPTTSRLTLTVAPVGTPITGEAVMVVPGTVDAQGRFTIRGLTPGRYRVVVSAGLPSGYTLKSSVFGGLDVLDFPLEVNGTDNVAGGVITFSTRSSELDGLVQDPSGDPAPGVTVLAYSMDERFWTPGSRRIQTVRPSSDGKYSMKGLPPGDYRLVAVADVAPGQWYDPAFLRSLGGFVTITIGEGGKVAQDLRAAK